MTSAGVVLVLVPSVSAVEHFLQTRTVAPLVRGSFERSSVLALSLVVALAAAAQVELFAPRTAGLALCGAAPWAAGELLSGRSRRHAASLLAALASAFGVSWLAWWIVSPRLAAELCLASVVAASAYLGVRGDDVEDATASARR